MTATVTPTIDDEIVRLTALIEEHSAEYHAGEAQIAEAAREFAAIHERRQDRRKPMTDAERDANTARTHELNMCVMAGNARSDAAMNILRSANARLRQARELATDMATARPIEDLQREQVDAVNLVATLEAQLAAARERRVAALTTQSAKALREADQALRDLPTDITFAKHAVLEAKIAVFDGASMLLATQLWASEQTLATAEDALAAAKSAHADALDAVRRIHAARTVDSASAERIRAELARQRAALATA